jgi:hypothetical protein
VSAAHGPTAASLNLEGTFRPASPYPQTLRLQVVQGGVWGNGWLLAEVLG